MSSGFDPDAVETVTMDSFTTLVDVHGPTREALSAHVDDPDPVAALWRSRAVDYRMVATFLDEYETYSRTTREALEYALAVHGHDLPESAVEDVVSTFDALPVFEDVAESVRRLADAGYEPYVLSNGEPDLLASIVERAGIGEDLVDTISAHEIRSYKPDAAIYELAAERTGTPLSGIAHAATPWYDVYGAMGAGAQGAWINRRDRPWDRFDGEPDLETGSLSAFVDVLDA